MSGDKQLPKGQKNIVLEPEQVFSGSCTPLEHPPHMLVPLSRRVIHWPVAKPILRLRVRALLQQKLHDLQVAHRRGQVQAGPFIVVGRVHLRGQTGRPGRGESS